MRILQILYDRRIANQVPPGNSHAWSELLGIDEASASASLQYLVESKMVEGVVIYAPGSTLPQTVLVHRLTAYGLDVIEGNFQDLKTVGNVTIAGDVIGGQVAIGNSNTQVQSVSIDSFNKLYDFLDTRLDVSQRAILKPLIRAFEEAVKAGSLNPETLRKIGEAIKTWGPAITGPIIDGIMRLLGLKGG